MGEDASESSQASAQPAGPEPARSASRPGGGVAQKSSASVRRALFARRRLDASSAPGGSPSPSGALQKPPTPPPSPSPGPLRSSTPPSSLSVSTSRPVSPGLSPAGRARVPPGPLADASSRGPACFHGDRAAAARPVSPFVLRLKPASGCFRLLAGSSHCFYFRRSVFAAGIINAGQTPQPSLTCDSTAGGVYPRRFK